MRSKGALGTLNRLGPENTVSKQGRGKHGDLLKVADKDWFKNIFVIITLPGLPARAGLAAHPNHGSSGSMLPLLSSPSPAPHLSRILGSEATCRWSVSVHAHPDTMLTGRVPGAIQGKA